MEKINANFLGELFRKMFLSKEMMFIVDRHLDFKFIPKEEVGYKFILKDAKEQFHQYDKIPSLGVISQKYSGTEAVQLAVDQIKESQIVDDEVLLNQLESYIRDSEFLLLNKAIVDLYGEGKKEEAMRLSKEESTRILEFSLRAQSEMFLGVFSDFDKCRKDWAEKTEQQPPVAFGIDALDDKYGGIDVGDTELWLARSGVGKALTLDTRIITPDGYMRMGDVKVGDIISTIHGEPQIITGVYPQGVRNCYEVTFTDGSVVRCDRDHLWTVLDRYHEDRVVTLTLGEIMKKGLLRCGTHGGQVYYKNGKKYYGTKSRPRWRLPLQEDAGFVKKDVLIDPYTLGVMLGDGSCTEGTMGITIADDDIEIVNRLKFPEKIEARYVNRFFYGIRTNGSEHSMRYYLEKYGLFNHTAIDKFIPDDYKFNDRETRLEILRGILDTDGYVNKNGLIEMGSISKRLMDDVRFVAQSLGCLCRVMRRKPSFYTDNGRRVQTRDHYRMVIVEPKGMSLFHLKRKADLASRPQKLHCCYRAIKSIKKVENAGMQCITVSSPDKLFMVEDFVPTHNSTVLRWRGLTSALTGADVLHIQCEEAKEKIHMKYSQMWTFKTYTDLKEDNFTQDELDDLHKTLKDIESYANDIKIYSFKKFGDATILDVRTICLEYKKLVGKFPRILIIDSFNLVRTGIPSFDNDPRPKYKFQECGKRLKNMCEEFGMSCVTAIQTGDVPFEVWNDEEKVIDRSYAEGDRTVVQPFSWVFSINQTLEEVKHKTCRIFKDKVRDYENVDPVFKVATNYNAGRFYDRKRTLEEFYDLKITHTHGGGRKRIRSNSNEQKGRVM